MKLTPLTRKNLRRLEKMGGRSKDTKNRRISEEKGKVAPPSLSSKTSGLTVVSKSREDQTSSGQSRDNSSARSKPLSTTAAGFGQGAQANGVLDYFESAQPTNATDLSRRLISLVNQHRLPSQSLENIWRAWQELRE